MPSARDLEMVVTSLQPLVGPRTVWLDPYGRLWHTTPALAAETGPVRHWRALGTFVRPSVDALKAALADVLQVRAA